LASFWEESSNRLSSECKEESTHANILIMNTTLQKREWLLHSEGNLMTSRLSRPVAFVLVLLMVISFVWSNPGGNDVVRAETGVGTRQNDLTADYGTVNTEWTIDDQASANPTYMSKIQTNLIERLPYMGTEQVKVVIFADSISLLHEALGDGRLRAQDDTAVTDHGLGTTILELPANVIPKVASLPNVRAILEYELPEAPDPRDFWQGPFSGDSPSPNMWQVTLTQGAVEAWSLGFEGEGVKVAVLDTGVDFGHPDLNGTQARVEDPASPYFGWPITFDSRSMRSYLSTGNGFPGAGNWFSDTSVTDTDSNTDGFLDTSGYDIGVIQSQSGVYHLGVHPDDYLRIRYGTYVGVLVTDSTTSGVYDAVYVDLDNDNSFADEKAAVKGDEVSSHDLDSDGLADRSGGMIYFIADGVNTVPYSQFIAQDMGVSNIIPTNGDLVTFALNDATEAGGSHGTLCASAVAAQGKVASGAVKGMAPKAKIIAVGNIYQGGNWWDNYVFAAEGYDGIPGTGDEANILSLSFGSSFSINKGFGFGERFVDEITTYYAPKTTFMSAAGNGGYGYGTVITPGSSPGVVTVGASTSTWTAEPANYTTWGDVIPWSDRGPTALGQVDPDILSVGAYGSGDVTLNQVGNANSAWGIWGGTSMATPVAAGIMSLLYESYTEAHGQYPDSVVAREIIMSSADNIHYDAMLQGAGIANASRAVQLANERYGVEASPSFWTAGDYRGTHYDAFANIMFPGDSDNLTFQVYNADQLNATQVSVSDEAHARTKSMFYNIQADRSLEDGYQGVRPDYLIPLIDSKSGLFDVPPGTDLVKISFYFDYFEFDPDWDYGIENRFTLAVYDWWDEDGDGEYWIDANSDGVVQQTEIEGYPNFSEIQRFALSSQAANRYEVRVHDPYERIHDGLLVGIFHTRTTGMVPISSVNVRVDTYELVDCGWLSVSPATLNIPPGGVSTFQADVNFPLDAKMGMYQAFVNLNYDSNESAIPITANIASTTTDFLINESSGELYDNGAIFGGYNWGWRYESGDWRYYFVEVPDGSFKQGQQLVANVSWDYVPTDIDVFLMGPTPDTFSASYPNRYGPYTIETKGRSADTWVGGGRFLFETATGGPQEIVAADLVSGLWGIGLHNVLNAGLDSLSNISVDLGTIELSPNPWDVGVVTDFSKLAGQQIFLANSTINLPDLDVTAFGVSQPIQLVDEVIMQDNPADASTSSWSMEIDMMNGGLLEVSTDSFNSIDIDLYVLRDLNSNGVPNWGSEIIASSTSPDETEFASIKKPADGKYWVFVHGWSVGGPSSTFNIDIEAIQGIDLQLSDLPTGALGAYQPENFNSSYTLPAVDGIYHGIIFAGPSYAAEVLSVRFYGEVMDVPPEFYGLTPAPGSIINNNQPLMGASFVDNGTGMNLSSVQMLVDGFDITNLATMTSSSIIWATPFLLTEGLHWVNVSARDNFGNYNSTMWSFTVDTIPPYLALLGPPDGSITSELNARVEGVTETGVDLRVNGITTLVLANGSFSRFVNLIEGPNPISVVATDLAGNLARVDVTVHRDTIPPPLMVTEPSSGSWLNYPTVIVRGVSEQGATVSVGGQLATVQSDGSFEVPVALMEGSNLINLTATDTAGNSASAQVIVNVDTIPPFLVVSSPDDGLLTNIDSLQATGMTEPAASLTINGNPIAVQPDGSFSSTITLQNGQNDIFFNVTDLAGNSNSVLRSVTLDQSQPPLTIQTPIDGDMTNKPYVEVRGSTEPLASLVVNGQFFQVESNGEFEGLIPLVDGDNLVMVKACDPAGNCATDSRNVFVDTTSPNADAGNDAIELAGEEISFDGSDSTDNDQIESFSWTFYEDGNEVELEGPEPSHVFDKVGMYEVLLEVTDRAGNSDEDVLWVKIIPPDDLDEDGIPDEWEIENFGSTAFDPEDDPDLDYLDNYEEYLVGTDPNDADTDGDGLKDGLDDDPLEKKSLDISDYWWIFVVVIVVLLILILYMVMRSGQAVPPPPEDEVPEEQEPVIEEPPVDTGSVQDEVPE
jgi:subtilisin family serine protease/uncharacterized protein YfaP (DUF2135 family)